MKKKKSNNTALIGFWLVLGANKTTPLLVCPALLGNKAVEKIESVSIKKAWSVSVQAPQDSSEGAIMFMVPEIINIANLDKPVEKYTSLWEIDGVKAKCEALTRKYIEQIKNNSK